LSLEERKQPPKEYYDHGDSDNVCFLCGNPQYRPVYTVAHFGFTLEFKKCRCGIVKQTPMPNQAFFEWFFNSDLFFSAKESKEKEIWGFYDYFTDEPCRMATSEYRYRKLRHIFERGRKPLEIMKVGPSTGTFLYVANQHGHHAIGCDVSANFVDYAKTKYNARIDHGRFEKMDYQEGQFDVLMLFNVIENIPNPDEFLRAVQRTIRIGGYFVLNYVDMKRNVVAAIQKEKYFLYRPPVCYQFDRDVMSRVLTRYGFEVVESHRDVRYLHLEKIFTLLRWRVPYRVARYAGIHRIPFKIYAYPSQILVAQRK
jgi:ubiquinone/menaquinone biosynthesis C-methylase UbiE